MKSLLNTYKDFLTEELDLAKLRLMCKERKTLSYVCLNLRIKWLEFKLSVVEGLL